MAASRYLTVVLMLSIPGVAFAGHLSTLDDKLLSYMRHRVAVSMAELGDKIDQCREQRRQSPTPSINPAKVGIDKETLAASILYLSSRNMRLCLGAAQLQAAYAIHNFVTVLEALGQEDKKIRAANQELLYPDIKELKHGAVFYSLPENVKAYLNQAVGRKPFDPVKVMKVNHLFH